MPEYKYVCTKCDKEYFAGVEMKKRNHAHKCECGNKALRVFTPPGAGYTFEPMWYEHFQPEPIWVTSKHQLKELSKKFGMEVPRLM